MKNTLATLSCIKLSLYLGIFVITALIATAVRRIWLHPLSKHPGPKLWAASRLPYIVSLLRGKLNDDMLRMHEKYGDVIRLGPNELSFATDEAWRDIYMHRPGHNETRKDPVWYMAPNDMPQNIVTTTDTHVRARMRRLLAPSFNEKSLRDQETVLEIYADKVMNKFDSIYDAQKVAGEPMIVNFLDWMNFYTMDIIADLALGESFYCIEGSDYHPWVKTLFNFFKGMILAAAASFFPLTRFLLQQMIPKQILKKQRAHTEFTNNKILQRLESKSQRPDLVTPFLKEMEKSPDKMSLGEIQSTFAILLVAGSEATTTTLLGVFYKLATHPKCQENLFQLLRSLFQSESDITVHSIEDLPFLDAVINEALRLCYAIPGGLPRVSPEGGDFYAGHFVPGGTSIAIRPYVVFHSERYFKRSWEYIPERWLPTDTRPKEFINDKLSACQPFNVGPTNCIGKSLAWAEMRLIVAKVIWKFQLKMTKERPFSWESLHQMMVAEKVPLWLTMERRGD